MDRSQEQTINLPNIGSAIRRNRLRAGITQVQLARTISRSGKFLSEVETGKARLTHEELQRLADAMGVTPEAVLDDCTTTDHDVLLAPRRVRDTQPTGMAVLSFTALVHHLDRCGWLRRAKFWMISVDAFPEEHDLALVEQLGALIDNKQVALRYVYSDARPDAPTRGDATLQGTLDALPETLLQALRWSGALRGHIDPAGDRIIGYALAPPIPGACREQTLLWVETEDVSWSDVMPLVYYRGVTRTFDNPNESVAFWYHVPRETGSRLLLELASRLKCLPHRRNGGQSTAQGAATQRDAR